MGRESRANEARQEKTHVIRWSGDQLDVKAYEATYQALAHNRPGGEREQQQMKELFAELGRLGVPSGKPSGDPDLELLTLAGPAELQISENDRTLLKKAVAAIQWPVYGLEKKDRALDLIENAAKIERPGEPHAPIDEETAARAIPD